MKNKRLLKRGWFGDTVSYIYLTILALIAIFPWPGSCSPR